MPLFPSNAFMFLNISKPYAHYCHGCDGREPKFLFAKHFCKCSESYLKTVAGANVSSTSAPPCVPQMRRHSWAGSVHPTLCRLSELAFCHSLSPWKCSLIHGKTQMSLFPLNKQQTKLTSRAQSVDLTLKSPPCSKSNFIGIKAENGTDRHGSLRVSRYICDLKLSQLCPPCFVKWALRHSFSSVHRF